MTSWPDRTRDAAVPGITVLVAIAVQVCRPGGADLVFGVAAPLVVLALATGRPGRTSRLVVGAVLVVQAAVHLGCAVGLEPGPAHALAGGWHLLLAAASVLLVRVGEQSVATALVHHVTRGLSVTGAVAAVVSLRTAMPPVGRVSARVVVSDAPGRAPPLRCAPAPA